MRVVFLTWFCRDPSERPTADMLLSQHPFCEFNPDYNFNDTELYAKIRGTFK
jgi:mitogen-activated protein kinase kinase kinase